MKWTSALVFIGLFLVVGAFCLWMEFPVKQSPRITALPQTPSQMAIAPPTPPPAAVPRESEEETFSVNLLDLLPEDHLTLIQIQNLESKKTMKLMADQDGWQIKFPVQDTADPAKMENLLHGLLAAQKLRQMKPEKGWDEYGLARPRLKIGLETAKKQGRRYLYLGNLSPVDNVLFARWEDEKTYFLLPVSFQGLFEQSVYDMREKRLFLKNGETPRSLRLHAPTGDYEIENQGVQWVWKDPEAMRWQPCPAGDAEALLEKLRGLFVKDFLETISEEESGLTQTGTRITVGLSQTKTEVLEVGKEADVRDAFYAKTDQGKGVLVARDKLNAFFDLFRSLAAQTLGQA